MSHKCQFCSFTSDSREALDTHTIECVESQFICLDPESSDKEHDDWSILRSSSTVIDSDEWSIFDDEDDDGEYSSDSEKANILEIIEATIPAKLHSSTEELNQTPKRVSGPQSPKKPVERIRKRDRLKNKLLFRPSPRVAAASTKSSKYDNEEFEILEEKEDKAGWTGDGLGNYQRFNQSFPLSSDPHRNQTKQTWNRITQFPKNQKETRNKRFLALVGEGIPHQYRRRVWKLLIGYEEFVRQNPGYINAITERVFGVNKPEDVYTVPTFYGDITELDEHFLTSEGEAAMRRIMCILATRFNQLDHCPALCRIVCVLLFYMPEEEALLSSDLILRRSLNKGAMFLSVLARHTALHRLNFSDLFQYQLPQLHAHTIQLSESLKNMDFAIDWINNFYVRYLPCNVIPRIFDLFLLRGCKILYYVGVALLEIASSALLGQRTEASFLSTLQGFCAQCTASTIFNRIRGYGRRMEKTLSRSHRENKHKITNVAEPEYQLYYRPVFQPSAILTSLQFEMLYEFLPSRYRIKDPTLLFSVREHGYSLQTMARKAGEEFPTILLIKTENDEKIGAFVTTKWEVNKTFGDHEMFLFTFHPTLKVFPARPQNNQFFITIKREALHIGMGNEGVGLYLDADLNIGTSHNSATYCNDILTATSDFTATCVELWGFINY